MSEVGFGRREVWANADRSLVLDFQMDRAGIRRIALRGELRTACARIAARGLPYAVAISPRRTGAFSKSFEIMFGHTWVAGMRRVAVRLANTDPGAAAIEFGSHHERVNRFGRDISYNLGGHHTLRRTLAFLSRVNLGTPTVR